MKLTIEVEADLVFKKDFIEILDEIFNGGIDMLCHSDDIKDNISWEVMGQEDTGWDANENL